MSSLPQNSTIILVHGAWAEVPCWSNVILPLKQQGFNVISALTPLTSLTDNISALNHALERTSGPVVLAGHAYAGAVIIGATDKRVKSLAYVAALATDQGETVAKMFYRDEPHPEAPKPSPDPHGFIWMAEDGFRRAVAPKGVDRPNKRHGCRATTDRSCVYSRVDSSAGMDNKTLVVFACGSGPHD